MGLILATAAILGFIAGSSYLSVLQKCSQEPYLCNHSNSWTWDAGPGTTVSTAEGHVQGTQWSSRLGRKFHAFLGIPYGQVYTRFEVQRIIFNWKMISRTITSITYLFQTQYVASMALPTVGWSEVCSHVRSTVYPTRSKDAGHYWLAKLFIS